MTETASGASQERQCALVLGMHRSGTSAVARVLSLIGAGLPRRLMSASGSNEAGHWEPKRIVERNEHLLLEGGSAWNDWRPFVAERALAPAVLSRYRAEIVRVIEEEYAGERLFVLKDPRISRLTPLYLSALDELGVRVKIVLVSRHPMEVAGSLEARDGMPVSDALLLWLRHELDAEAATRGRDRLVLSYESLMADPDDGIRRLQGFLGPVALGQPLIDFAAAQASLRHELRHHQPRDIFCPALPEAAAWARDALTAFSTLERDPQSRDPERRLDELRPTLDAYAARQGDRIAYVIATARRAQAEIQDLLRQRTVGAARIRELEARNAEHTEEFLRLTEEFQHCRREAISVLATTTRTDFRLPRRHPQSAFAVAASSSRQA